MAGGKSANRIARWEGGGWSALGDGIDGGVFAITFHENNLFASGRFTRAGNTFVTNIARWNGSNWFALGSGVSLGQFPGFALALASYSGDLYVGGVISVAGGKASSGLARWSGPTDTGVIPAIASAVRSGKRLIVSGANFDQGAVILLNGVEQKTIQDGENPTTRLIGKKTGRKAAAGDKVRVRNRSGAISSEFTYTP
jgi:hypothetical protein